MILNILTIGLREHYLLERHFYKDIQQWLYL